MSGLPRTPCSPDHDVDGSIHSIGHQVGTARIAATAEGGVVDPKLKVFGVEGLRVVDASVFPAQISGHPAATIIAIAEKASEMILTGS